MYKHIFCPFPSIALSAGGHHSPLILVLQYVLLTTYLCVWDNCIVPLYSVYFASDVNFNRYVRLITHLNLLSYIHQLSQSSAHPISFSWLLLNPKSYIFFFSADIQYFQVFFKMCMLLSRKIRAGYFVTHVDNWKVFLETNRFPIILRGV